ncbi:FO synthase subunit 1, partial [Durusdinium trenchii]
MLAPFSVGFIKGWRRSLAALIICEGIRSLGIELDDLTDQFKVELFLTRLEGDWDRCSVKKPWMYKDAWTIHVASGGFIAITEQLECSVPQKDFKDAITGIREQFQMGLLDSDIVNFLESTVPPVSLQDVPFVRSLIVSMEQRKMHEAQQTERELELMSAKVEKLKHTFMKDMEVLRARLPDKAHVAKEAALDKKYLANRQKTFGWNGFLVAGPMGPKAIF